MTELLILITAIVFYFMGRYSNTPMGEIKAKVESKIRQFKAKDIPTVITYPTREEQDYEESEQKQIDQEIEKNLREKGLE